MNVLVMGDVGDRSDRLVSYFRHAGQDVRLFPLELELLDVAEPLAGLEPELVLLEAVRREADVARLCETLRRRVAAPIVVLLEDVTGAQVVAALRAGADDVLPVTLSMAELDARIDAILRRTSDGDFGPSGGYVDPYLRVDLSRRRVTAGGHLVKLSPTEFSLFSHLVENRGRLVSQDEAIEAVWERGDLPTHSKMLSLYIGYLRRKLEADPCRPRYIHTRYGKGYWFGGPYDREPA
jgi:DNA-binding response OmpR family regulator